MGKKKQIGGRPLLSKKDKAGQFKLRKPKDFKIIGEVIGSVKEESFLPALTPQNALAEAKTKVSKVFEALTEVLERPVLASGDLAHMRDTFKFWSSGMSEMDKLAKERQRERVLAHGTVLPETKGSKVLEEDGWRFTLRPTKTGYDDRKVEAMLRAKGLDPEVAMHKPEVPYTCDDARLEALLGKTWEGDLAPTITQADLDACKVEVSYAVLQPEKIGGLS